MYEMGQRAMALLLHILENGENGTAESILLDTQLAIRESA
jgi:DNA-binding LacI/PurR family transcriptional regulator